MPKARKRKVPITADNATQASSSKPQSSRTVIRQFHVLLKEQAKLQAAGDLKALVANQDQIDELGGLEVYQSMSAIGQGKDRGGGSEKVFITWLKKLGAHKGPKLNLLEVGALLPDNYASHSSWISNTPIDLHSRHPAITEQDFLQLDATRKYDLISLSLVVNFVPIAEDRGRMLRLAHEMLETEGKLFLALPLPCLTNSRYTTFESLDTLMRAIGFDELCRQWKPNGKMAYWLYTKSRDTDVQALESFRKKVVLRTGNRNNFCILA